MPDMNSDLKCRVCNPEPNTHWFAQSAVDELTAGLRATLEARTAALTRTIERAEAAEAKIRQVEALADEWQATADLGGWWAFIRHVRAVLEGGR